MTSSEAILSLEVAASPAAPSIARRFVAETLRSMGQSEEVVDEMRLAVSEVVSAVVEAAMPGPFQVSFEVDGPRLVLPALPPTTADDLVDRRRVLDGLAHVAAEYGDDSTRLSVVTR